jgi:hypothetical protein
MSAAAPVPARARLANAAPIRTVAAETMAALVQDPKRRPADAGLRKPSGSVGNSGVCNAGTDCDGTPCLGVAATYAMRVTPRESTRDDQSEAITAILDQEKPDAAKRAKAETLAEEQPANGISPQYARARAPVMGLYKWPGITFPTRAATPARARAPLANAAPIRTAVAETMAAFAQDPRRRPADAGLRKPSSSVGNCGVCNTGTACDGTPLL